MTIGVNSAGLILNKKNYLSEGNFDLNPWQRGTSWTGIGGVNTGLADNFRLNDNSDGDMDAFKTSDAPTISQAKIFGQSCLHIDVTTADAAIGAAQYSVIQTFIEGYNFAELAQRQFVVSFWHKHTKTGIYTFAVQNDGSDRSYAAEYTQDVSDTWEFASIVVAPSPSAGTWDYTNGVGARLYFNLALGTNFHTTADSWQTGNYLGTSNQVNALDSNTNNFKLFNILINEGDIPLPYPVDTRHAVLDKCQRYYYKSYNQGVDPGTNTFVGQKSMYAQASTASAAGYELTHKNSMRTTPTYTVYSQAGTSGKVTQDDASEVNGAAGSIGEDGALVEFTNGAGRYNGYCHFVASADMV